MKEKAIFWESKETKAQNDWKNDLKSFQIPN